MLNEETIEFTFNSVNKILLENNNTVSLTIRLLTD